MTAADGHSTPILVCGIILSHETPGSLDKLLGGVAVLDNLCLVLIGDAAGIGLPVDWTVAQMTEGFIPAGRFVITGALDAETVFEDMARRFGARAIGVRLGQSPGNGAIPGVVEAGGMTLAEGAEKDTSQGFDMTAPVERLAEAIVAICRRASDSATRLEPLTTQETREVCVLLRQATGHDFKHYKETTLSRRILRRIHVLRCDTFDDYLSLLKSSPDEARALMRDLLIGVTAFFRDPDAFAALDAKVMAPLLAQDGPQVVRLWLAGCSTGPEAYSLAMLVHERLAAAGHTRDVQIFATDLDERALNVARVGVYSAAVVEALSPERLARYFTRIGGRYQVNRELRQMIAFSPHNLIADPPFSKMDLIVCRNVMIYLGAHLQKKLISVFHYALRDSGYLFLGSSEAVTGHGDLFRVIDSRARIAQRKDVGVPDVGPRQPVAAASVTWQTHAGAPSQNIAQISQRIVLDEFAPPWLIVTDDGQITFASARAGPFLDMPEGQFVNNLIRVVRKGIRTGVRAAWSEALKTRRKSVHEGLTVGPDNDRRRTRIVVQPMPDLGEEAGTYMVVFFDLGQAAAGDAPIPANPDSERLFADLEAELFQAREELEHTVQDLEGANEELKSSNEELLSMNEELQSANEELESSKDEIERANTALEDANTDLVNLLSSTQIATIFLDAAGNLRRFTPAASEFYNITGSDIGRPLRHFTHRFADLPPMPALDDTGVAVETEAVREDGRTFLRRLTPYTTESGAATGVVVTLVDITAAKQAEDRIRQSREQLWFVTEHAPVMIAQVDADLRYTFVNSAFARLSGRRSEDLIGHTLQEAMGDAAFALAEPHVAAVLAGRNVSYDMELERDGTPLSLTVNHAPEFDVGGRVIGFVTAIIDVTQGAIAEKALLASEARFRASQQVSPNGFMMFTAKRGAGGGIEDFVFDFANDASLALVKMTNDDLIGKAMLDVLPGNKASGLYDQYVELVGTGEPFQRTLGYDDDGISGWFELTAVRVADGCAALFTDITARKEQERQIFENALRVRSILDSVVAFVGALTPEGLLTEANQPALEVAGLSRDDVIGKPFWEAFWWSYDPAVQERLKQAIALAQQGKPSRYDVKIRASGDNFIFIDFLLMPLLDAEGRVVELIPSAVDITDRLHAEDAVHQNAERLSRTLDGVSTLVGLLDADGTVTDLNATALAHVTVPKASLLGLHFSETPWWDVSPELRAQIRQMVDTAATGSPSRADMPYRSLDGAIRWVELNIVAIKDEGGRIIALVPCGTDITERRNSELALAESRERLHMATRAARLGTFDFNPSTGAVRWDARSIEVLGLSGADVPFAEFLAMVHEDDRHIVQDDLALGHEPGRAATNSTTYRVNRSDGTLIWVEGHASIIVDGKTRAVGTLQDITERKRAEERQTLLLHELNHRVKNSLATIQAMASHTLRHSDSPEAFRDSFSGRLFAIAASHDILVGNEQSGADLEQLIQSQIGPYASGDQGRLVLNGPQVTLGATVSHALGLILHELATNASKYGALSNDEGVLRIDWHLIDDRGRDSVLIDWVERKGPPVVEPTRRGFGSRLIAMTLSHSLDGNVNMTYNPEGFAAQLTTRLVADDDL